MIYARLYADIRRLYAHRCIIALIYAVPIRYIRCMYATKQIWPPIRRAYTLYTSDVRHRAPKKILKKHDVVSLLK